MDADTGLAGWGEPFHVPNGPRGDYAIAMIVAPHEEQGDIVYRLHNDPPREFPANWYVYVAPNYDAAHQRGPIRIASVAQPTSNGNYDGPNYKFWTPTDNFAWLSDGASNQILFGEKHVPISRIDECEGPTGSIFGATWDCGILMPADNWREMHCARSPTTRLGEPLDSGRAEVIVSSPSKYANHNPDFYAFGSVHPGICNFLIGDGAVRSLNVSTLPLLVCQLVDTKDGNAVSLP
jgi:hypothetical protein